MTTAEEAAAAHREREKELWSAIEDYKAGDVDHREVQVRIDRFASASDLVWAIEYGRTE